MDSNPLIVKFIPSFATVDLKANELYCNYCFKKADKLHRCSHCKFVRYCSKECQAKDWNDHDHQIDCNYLYGGMNPMELSKGITDVIMNCFLLIFKIYIRKRL